MRWKHVEQGRRRTQDQHASKCAGGLGKNDDDDDNVDGDDGDEGWDMLKLLPVIVTLPPLSRNS